MRVRVGFSPATVGPYAAAASGMFPISIRLSYSVVGAGLAGLPANPSRLQIGLHAAERAAVAGSGRSSTRRISPTITR